MQIDIVQLTKQLMAIPSTRDILENNSEAIDEILAIVKKELQGNFPIEEFESKGIKSILVHNTTHGTKQFKIILNAHLDVALAQKEQFTPYEKDGRLYGRGGYDMKAALVVMLFLFKELAKKLPYSIALQIVTDEEMGGYNGTGYQVDQGIRADFVIVGDCGSNLALVNKAKGILWIKLHTRGVKAHGAYPWKGENALRKLHIALNSLHDLFPVPESESWVTTMNLAKIETSNLAFNHVPDDASAFLDFRFTEGTKNELIEKIKQAIGPAIEIEVLFGHAPEYIEPENPYLLKLQEASQQVTGNKAALKGAHAPSDLRHFNTVGCVGVQFGAVGEHQHGDDEWVDLNSIEQYYAILKHFLLNLPK